MIADALSQFDGVLALGGGACSTPGHPRAAWPARGVPVVLLRSSARDAGRAGSATAETRPLLADNPHAAAGASWPPTARPLYREVATLIVEHRSPHRPGQVAAQIAARLHERWLGVTRS